MRFGQRLQKVVHSDAHAAQAQLLFDVGKWQRKAHVVRNSPRLDGKHLRGNPSQHRSQTEFDFAVIGWHWG